MDRQIEWSGENRSRKWRLIGVVFLGLVLLALLAYALSATWTMDADSDLAWSQVRRGTLELRSMGNGEFISTRQRLVSAVDPGVVEEIFKHNGDTVKQGDVILRLRSPNLVLELNSAANELAKTRINALELQSNSALTLAKAQHARDSARLQLQVQESELKAYSKLNQDHVISQLQFISVQAKYREAKGELESAQKMLTLTKQLQGQQQKQMRQSVDLGRLKHDRLAQRVTELEVAASMDGVVKNVEVKLGDTVSVGSRLAIIGPVGPDRSRLRFPQRDLSRLALGLPVEIGFNGQSAAGTITQISPDLTDGYVLVDVQCANLPPVARVGMAVRGEAKLGTLADVVYAPSSFDPPHDGGALKVHRRRNGETTVVLLRDVRSEGGNLVFSSGVRPGDFIAIDPNI